MAPPSRPSRCTRCRPAPRLLIGLLLSTLSLAVADSSEHTRDWPPTNATLPFAPSWRMNDSTLLYWRNASGYVSNETLASYGMFIWDWAHAAKVWINDCGPAMDNGAALAEQCRRAKLVNPHAKCIVYRNTVKALNQFAEVSALVDSAAHAGYFLPWKPGATQSGDCDLRTNGGPPLMPNPQVECHNHTSSDVHVPMCDGANKTKCSDRLYFGTHQTPMVPGRNWAGNTLHPFENLSCTGGQCRCGLNPCGEYLFDLRNSSMRRWFVEVYMSAAVSPFFVDGLILDDSWKPDGPTEEDRHAAEDIGLSPDDVSDLVAGWEAARNELQLHIDALHKYIAPTYGGDALSWSHHAPMNSTKVCLQKLRNFCRPTASPAAPHYFSVAYYKVQPPMFGVAPVNMDLDMAYFLVARGEYAWIGSGPILGWQLSHWWATGKTRLIEPRDFRPHWFDQEFGEPLELCSETTTGVSGVFTRKWSTVTAMVDCNSLSGEIKPA
jgi:hypothetical protein